MPTSTMPRKITPVKECIPYIESCGFRLLSRKRGVYWFEKRTGTMPNGNDYVVFTLNEIRHAKDHGW